MPNQLHLNVHYSEKKEFQIPGAATYTGLHALDAN